MLQLIVLLVACVTAWAAWKTFEWFKWSRSEAFYASKWEYYKKRIGFSFGSFLVVLFVGTVLVSPDENKTVAAENLPQSSAEAASKAEIPVVEKQPEPVARQAEIAARQEAASEADKSQVAEQAATKIYTDEEIKKLEDEAQYHGDDPIVRARFGLPPRK